MSEVSEELSPPAPQPGFNPQTLPGRGCSVGGGAHSRIVANSTARPADLLGYKTFPERTESMY